MYGQITSAELSDVYGANECWRWLVARLWSAMWLQSGLTLHDVGVVSRFGMHFFRLFLSLFFLRFSAENAFFVVGLVFQDVATGVSTISKEILEKLIRGTGRLGVLCWESRREWAREFAKSDGKWVSPCAESR